LFTKALFWNHFDLAKLLDLLAVLATHKRRELEMAILIFKTAQHLRKSCIYLCCGCGCFGLFLTRLSQILPEYVET
jgi:hypothetical protein